MTNRTLVIAEGGSCWRFGDNHLTNAERMIRAVKECGADVFKAQWTSNPAKLAQRRNAPKLAAMYKKYVAFPQEWLLKLKAMCDEVGVEFACTAYLAEDVPVIVPFIKRAKVSSFEALDEALIDAYPQGMEVIVSHGLGTERQAGVLNLLCVSKYPAKESDYKIEPLRLGEYQGVSDHCANPAMGGIWRAAGAEIIEAHVRLNDTPLDCPDYPHSLRADGVPFPEFKGYVQNIRFVETME